MTTPELSLSEVNTLTQIIISGYTQLEWAVDCAALDYGKASVLAADAQALFDLAIDDEAQDLDLFRQNVVKAEARKSEAYRELDAAKRDLLAMSN